MACDIKEVRLVEILPFDLKLYKIITVLQTPVKAGVYQHAVF